MMLAVGCEGADTRVWVPEAVDATTTAQRTAPIVYGAPVNARRHNAVVALLAPPGASVATAFCSGTLIGPRTVLTAAHCIEDDCVDGELGDAVRVLVRNETKGTQQIYAVSRCRVHKSYDEFTLHNDIALLGLATDVPKGLARPVLARPGLL